MLALVDGKYGTDERFGDEKLFQLSKIKAKQQDMKIEVKIDGQEHEKLFEKGSIRSKRPIAPSQSPLMFREWKVKPK